jgi:hypothetical protein
MKHAGATPGVGQAEQPHFRAIWICSALNPWSVLLQVFGLVPYLNGWTQHILRLRPPRDCRSLSFGRRMAGEWIVIQVL